MHDEWDFDVFSKDVERWARISYVVLTLAAGFVVTVVLWA